MLGLLVGCMVQWFGSMLWPCTGIVTATIHFTATLSVTVRIMHPHASSGTSVHILCDMLRNHAPACVFMHFHSPMGIMFLFLPAHVHPASSCDLDSSATMMHHHAPTHDALLVIVTAAGHLRTQVLEGLMS